jgi:hypothetical protein
MKLFRFIIISSLAVGFSLSKNTTFLQKDLSFNSSQITIKCPNYTEGLPTLPPPSVHHPVYFMFWSFALHFFIGLLLAEVRMAWMRSLLQKTEDKIMRRITHTSYFHQSSPSSPLHVSITVDPPPLYTDTVC